MTSSQIKLLVVEVKSLRVEIRWAEVLDSLLGCLLAWPRLCQLMLLAGRSPGPACLLFVTCPCLICLCFWPSLDVEIGICTLLLVCLCHRSCQEALLLIAMRQAAGQSDIWISPFEKKEQRRVDHPCTFYCWNELYRLGSEAAMIHDRKTCSLPRIAIWMVVSNIFHFHPYLGNWSNLTIILLRCVETTNWPCLQGDTFSKPSFLDIFGIYVSFLGCSLWVRFQNYSENWRSLNPAIQFQSLL